VDDLDALASEDLVEGGGELAVAVMNQEADRQLALLKRPGQVARLLRDPPSVRVLSQAGEAYAAALKLDEEEHVDPPQGDGFDGEQVAGDHGLRLAADELAPGKPASMSCGPEPGLAQQLSHARRRDLDPEPGEFPAIR
jgi:hypothetical protein